MTSSGISVQNGISHTMTHHVAFHRSMYIIGLFGKDLSMGDKFNNIFLIKIYIENL